MKLNLLIADTDNQLIARCQEWCLLKHIALQYARSGLACLEKLRHSPPDVLALAVDLPWGGGDGVLQVMSEESALSQIPVVLIDGEAGAVYPRGALPGNVLGRLAKPFDVETLLELGFAAADCRELLESGFLAAAE